MPTHYLGRYVPWVGTPELPHRQGTLETSSVRCYCIYSILPLQTARQEQRL